MIRRLFFIFCLLVIVLIVAVVAYIRPDKQLAMNYEQVDLKVKVWNMLKNHEPQVELTNGEMNNLAKKKVIEYLNTQDKGVKVTGVEFIIHEQELRAHLNGKWGMIPFGVTLNFHMESNGSDLILEHRSTRIRQMYIPSSWWSLLPISVSLKEHIPNFVEVDHIEFKTDSIVLIFKIDWLMIPQLLLDSK
ncbi:hypothetical protein ACP8HI_26750 [Paenibacillus sp. FA6]|uniref:hypothetical protein n=1 Tax=Paenibacillus sp. FA6 TaxID=3413029 RepID=UPI003F65C5BD